MQKTDRNNRRIQCAAFALLACVLLLPQFACRTMESASLEQATPSPTATPTATPIPTSKPTQTEAPTVTPKPGIDQFHTGYGDGDGYLSWYFNFGFSLPYGWYCDDEQTLDKLNNLQTKRYYGDDYRKEVITRLRGGDVMYEYYAYNLDTGEDVTIYVSDYSTIQNDPITELGVLQSNSGWLNDPEGDGTKDIENLRLETVVLLGVEHPVYRYEKTLDGERYSGAYLVLKQGTTVAQLNLVCSSAQTILDVFKSFRPFA